VPASFTSLDPLDAPRSVRMVRRFDAPPSRIYRCLTVPEELIRWVPQRVEGSLAVGTRSILVFPDQRVWWDVSVLESDRRFEFRWPWQPGETWETTVSVLLKPAGYGTLLTLTDGPFDLRVPGVLDAYAEALGAAANPALHPEFGQIRTGLLPGRKGRRHVRSGVRPDRRSTLTSRANRAAKDDASCYVPRPHSPGS
jgi:uncharacterized protein YndB with AHSA1/START domain